MKAVLFKKAGKRLEFAEVPRPSPKAGELLVRVQKCGICATDLHLSEVNDSGASYNPDSVIGHEYAGDVVEVGPDVSDFEVGDRVVGFPLSGCGQCDWCRRGLVGLCPDQKPIGGGFAEYSLAPAIGSVKLPNALSYEDGALAEPLAVGLHGAAVGEVTADSRILVLGGGPVGLAVTYCAALRGARKIAVVARQQWRGGMAKIMGASHFLQTGPALDQDVAGALGSAPDIVFECVGSPGVLMQAIRHAAPMGVVVSMGFGLQEDAIWPAEAAYKAINIRFALAYSTGEFGQSASLMTAGNMSPRHMITRRVGLADVPDAVERLRAGSRDCKVMVDLSH